MGKLYCIIGMSCSGKTTLYNSLIKMADILNMKPIIKYTTRPIRSGEQEGVDYFYIDKDRFDSMVLDNKMVSYRSYKVYDKSGCASEWFYGVSSDFVYDLDNSNYITICDIDTYTELRDAIGSLNITPIYLYANDDTIIKRMLERVNIEKQACIESDSNTDNKTIESKYRDSYKEYCRRFIEDIDRYSLEAADAANIPEELRFFAEESIYFKVMDVIYKDLKK